MIPFIVFVFIGIITCLAILDRILKGKPEYVAAKKMQGPDIYPIIGNTPNVMFMNGEKTFKFLREGALLYKGAARFWAFGVLHISITRARDLELLMTSPKYITKSKLYHFGEPFFGTGLLTSTGQKWFQRRRILTPAFHFTILQDFYQIFKEESQKFLKILSGDEHKNGTELQKIVPRFTLNTICETAMGVKLDAYNYADNYRNNILKIGEWLLHRSVNLWLHEDSMYKITGLAHFFNRIVDEVHSFSWSVIDQRRKAYKESKIIGESDKKLINLDGKKKRSAMLDTLLEAEANGFQINEDGIREEVDTFMFEGYDTTSAGILFTLFMLAHHSDWQALAYEEIIQILGNRKPDELTIQDFSDMKIFNRIIKETLRIYPPVPFIGRQLREPIKIANVDLPIGTQIHIHIYDLHRDPDQFPNPDKFDPDRFLPENISNYHPLAYIPFSAGPRNCIGQKFAMLEMQTLIVNVLLKYQLQPITRVEDVVFIADMVLRPKTKIRIKFEPRSVTVA